MGATDRTCFFEIVITTTTTATTTTAAASGCNTVSGSVPNAPCVFPFKYGGQTYTSCTTAGGFSKPWCSTRTNIFGFHVQGNWGDCNEATCPVSSTSSGSGYQSGYYHG